ncbi:MAG: insulinase family protein [Bacteroidia bacterium]|nr:insulinase family protein [Bacteroidia bacterium]
MKKLQLLLALIFCALGTIQAGNNDQSGPEKKILPYPILQKKLPNGLNVVTVPYDSPGLAAFYIVMRVGSRDEVETGKTGFAHFFEHMMFRGTEKYSKEKYSDELKATGASANANTWLDRTVYHMTGNAAKLEKMFELEADRFMNLKYSVQDFKTEAGAVKGEYTKNSASPYVVLDEKLNDAAFTTHTYKHTTMGFFNDVVDMPNQYEFSIEFFRRYYRPEYATIIVVGDVTPEKVNALSEKYFGMWQTGNYVTKIPAEPAQMETRYTHVKKANFPPVVTLNYKGPAYAAGSREPYALDLLLTMLFSEKSELYKKLVITEQKARELDGSFFLTRDPYLAKIQASLVNASDMQYVRDEITKALEKAKTTPFSEKEINEAKMRLKYSFAMGMDSPTRIAESLSFYTWVSGDPETINTSYRQYDLVSAADMMAAAKKYLVPQGLTIATISADENCPVK